MKLIVQIPCLNEEQTLRQTLADIPREIPGVDRVEVLIVDDGSQDRTIAVAEAEGVEHIVRHKHNRGLARAFRSGLEAALAAGADVIVNTDGDNQYAGADIPKLIEPILRGEADIVVGDRQTAKVAHFSPFKKRLQALGSRVVRSLSRTDVPDAVSGFRAISRDAALELNIVSSFSYTIEMLIQAGRKGLRVASVPIGTNPKTRESRLFRSLPGFVARSVATMLRIYAMYRPLHAFLYIGFALMALGSLPVLRFLWTYLSEGSAGQVQSLILGGALLVMGPMTLMIGVLADLIGFNRQLIEMTLERVRRIELAQETKDRPLPVPGTDLQLQRAAIERLAEEWQAELPALPAPEAPAAPAAPVVQDRATNDERPCVIFDCHHPKHYLTIRRLGQRCEAEGIRAIWTMHDKDVLVDLVRADGFEPLVLAKSQKGLLRKLGELAVYDSRLLAIARREQPVALVGKTVSLAHVGRALGIPSILINDDDAAANPQFRYLGYPFATRIITAECLNEDYGPRQRRHPGLMELAYLHPDVFQPDVSVRAELGLGSQERLFLIRLAAFDAYHDVAGAGLSRALLEETLARLRPRGRVFIVSEADLPPMLADLRLPTPPDRLHHVLAACDLVIGDGLTVCVEAALLGVPAIAVGSYIGKHSYSEAIERKFGLMYGFQPQEQDRILERLDLLLTEPDLKAEWARRRGDMLGAWSDPTEVYWEELSRFLPAAGRDSRRAA